MKILRKKFVIAFTIIAILTGLLIFAAYLKSVADYKRTVNDISIEEICFSDFSDGVYIGECDVNFIYAKVEVTLHDGKIINIKISKVPKMERI